MGSYLLVFTLAALSAALLMPALMLVGRRIGALDNTREPPIPRMGGWAIGLGASLSLLLVGIVFDPTGGTLLGSAESLRAVVIGAGLILLLGGVDDIVPLRARTKFIAQVLIALLVWWMGLRITLVTAPLGSVALGPWVGVVITVAWLVLITNAFNLLDGADGVAAGSAFFAATAVFMISVALGHPAVGLVAAGLAGAVLGFLPFNFPPARAFLGDAGSLLLGFTLAALAIRGSTKGPTLVAIAVPIVAFAVPVFDTTITLLRRAVRGRPLFERDHGHLHHQLAQAGFSPRQVAGLLIAVSAMMAVLAMLFVNENVRSYAVILIIFGAGFWVTARFLRLHELQELARLARRSALQPKVMALNVGLRRATERVQDATDLDDLFGALAEVFRHGEFDDVAINLRTPPGGVQRTWRLGPQQFKEEPAPRRADEWEVICPFAAPAMDGELVLRRRMGRRSLLLDVNLLVEILQPALERAARRIA